MTRRVLLAGIGNIFCTDDGFGSAVIARLLERAPDGVVSGDVRVVDYGIRGMHLAYDLLDPPDVLILIDALPNRGYPGQVSVLRIEPNDLPASAGEGGQLDAHGMDPLTLLSNLVSLGGHLPEVTLLVGCQVADTGEGMRLTTQVAAAVDQAAGVVEQLLKHELIAAG
jgi:hydrogenase maturation protease